MIRTVLVPLDGSKAAEAVIPYVQLIASRTGAAVRLLTVVHEDTGEARAGEALAYLDDRAARAATPLPLPRTGGTRGAPPPPRRRAPRLRAGSAGGRGRAAPRGPPAPARPPPPAAGPVRGRKA